jgi:hypothetical protein
MNALQLRKLIDGVSNDFYKETEIRVLENARHALLTPALPHLDTVTRHLEEGRITVPFLEGTLDVVLNNAARDPEVKSRRSIDDQAIKKSMASYCPYLFWC